MILYFLRHGKAGTSNQAIGLTRDAFADRADHAVARAADPESADHHEVRLLHGEIFQNLGVMLAVHHPRFEFEIRLAAHARNAIEIAVGDELQAHRA